MSGKMPFEMNASSYHASGVITKSVIGVVYQAVYQAVSCCQSMIKLYIRYHVTL